MSLKLITAPTTFPVSLSEAKLHCRIDTAADDALVTALITAATEMAEQKTGRALMTQTWELTLDGFPQAFELTRVPVQSVVSLKYIDLAGVEQTISSGLYALDTADDFSFGCVAPVYDGTWPAARDQFNSVSLRFVAGYASAAAVPQSIKSWILLQVGAMYEHREAEGAMMMHKLGFADRLLDRYLVNIA